MGPTPVSIVAAMPTDDEADDGEFGTPLPPEDRLWRHPSEMGAEGDRQHIVLVSRSTGGWGRMLAVGGLAALVGAATTIGVLAATGTLSSAPAPSAVQVQRIEADAAKVPGESDLAIADKVLPSVATVQASGAKGTTTGTAVVFQDDGHLVTTADLVDGATAISVTLNDGSKLDATLVGRSVDADVAVIKVDRQGLPVAHGAKSVAKTFGSHTVIIDAGKPTRAPVINVGFVSAESRPIVTDTNTPIFGLVQVSTRPNVSTQGAGTVIVDDGGTVIGLVSSRAENLAVGPEGYESTTTSSTAASVGANRNAAPRSESARDPQGDAALTNHLAIPADLVWDIAGQLVDSGQVVRPAFPATGRDLSATEAAQLDVAGGFRIDRPLDGSPAQKAGLRAGDVIIELGDEHVGGQNDLVVAVRHHRPGEQVKVAYLRDGERTSTLATLEARPELP